MTDTTSEKFDADFFVGDTYVAEPYSYFEHLRAQCPVQREPHHDVVRQLRRDHPGLRLTRSGAVTATLIPAICEQRVTGLEARRSYRMLTRAVAEPAPGGAGRRRTPDVSSCPATAR